MDNLPVPEWLVSLGQISLAAIGGTLGYIMREHDKDHEVSAVRAAIEGFGSGFVGILVMMLCHAMEFGVMWTGFLVGMLGWLGANASIRLLERIAYDRLGVKLRADTEKRVEDAASSEAEK